MVRLAMIGGGRMGEALLGGLLDRQWALATELVVVEKSEARREVLSGAFPGATVLGAVGELEKVTPVDGVVLAVKPADVAQVCADLVPLAPGRVLSIAAGVRLDRLESLLGPGVPVVRAMPNTPALVGQGAAAVAPGASAGSDDLDWAEEVLGAVGSVVRVGEAMLDAVTGLSGSGPAYVFLVAEALMDAGVLVGLPRDVSEQLAVQTLLGAATLLAESGEDPHTLRHQVTSPGGTTAAGLEALEKAGVRGAFLQAVRAATERSRELGRS